MIEWNKYTNIPYCHRGRSLEKDGGLDCWGLVVYFYKHEFGIDLPFFTNMYYESSREISDLNHMIDQNKVRDLFVKVDRGLEGDILLYRVHGEPIHATIKVDKRRFLHSHKNNTSVIIEDINWRNKLESAYRHKLRMG